MAVASIAVCPRCGAKNRVDERAERLQPVCGRCGSELEAAEPDAAPTHPLEGADATFSQQVLGVRGTPVLLDCWAPWCGPCRALAPVLEQLATGAGGRYVVAKLDIDRNPRVRDQFRIQSIPTLLIFKDGQLV